MAHNKNSMNRQWPHKQQENDGDMLLQYNCDHAVKLQ